MAFLCYNKIKKAHDLSTVSGRQDSNLRHLGPKPSTLPSWATSRSKAYALCTLEESNL